MTTKTNLKIVTIFTIALLVIPNSALGTDSTEIEIDAEIILPDYIVPDIYCEPAVTDDPIAEVEVEQINTTEIYINSYWNETTPETVKEFLTLVPKCPWFADDAANMCCSRTRYLVIEGHAHGIELDEITLTFVGRLSGHRCITFHSGNRMYYNPNWGKCDTRVLDHAELTRLYQESTDLDGFGLKDHKQFDDEWFEKHGY